MCVKVVVSMFILVSRVLCVEWLLKFCEMVCMKLLVCVFSMCERWFSWLICMEWVGLGLVLCVVCWVVSRLVVVVLGVRVFKCVFFLLGECLFCRYGGV